MWFSPRSKKVRYVVSKVSVHTQPHTVNDGNDGQESVYGYVPTSPPGCVPVRPAKAPTTSRQKQKMQTSAEMNQERNLEADEGEGGAEPKDECQGELGSLLSQPSGSAGPQVNGEIDLLASGSTAEVDSFGSLTEVSLPLADQIESPGAESRNEAVTPDKNLCENSLTPKKPVPLGHSGKRGRCRRVSSSTSKRHRSSIPSPSGNLVKQMVLSEDIPQSGCPVPPASKLKVGGTLRRKNSNIVDDSASPSPGVPPPTLNMPSYRRMISGSSSSSASLMAVKRNHRGETLLHIASIKVRSLLGNTILK